MILHAEADALYSSICASLGAAGSIDINDINDYDFRCRITLLKSCGEEHELVMEQIVGVSVGDRRPGECASKLLAILTEELKE